VRGLYDQRPGTSNGLYPRSGQKSKQARETSHGTSGGRGYTVILAIRPAVEAAEGVAEWQRTTVRTGCGRSAGAKKSYFATPMRWRPARR